MATSVRDIWQSNPWWAKLLLAIAVGLFVMEALGIVDATGLAALNLTAITFIFSMYGTLGGTRSTLDTVVFSLENVESSLAGVESSLENVESSLAGIESALESIQQSLDRIDGER
ncbi:MAG: hypothetical protein ABEJ92_05220 [Halobacteriales archaeon]